MNVHAAEMNKYTQIKKEKKTFILSVFLLQIAQH